MGTEGYKLIMDEKGIYLTEGSPNIVNKDKLAISDSDIINMF